MSDIQKQIEEAKDKAHILRLNDNQESAKVMVNLISIISQQSAEIENYKKWTPNAWEAMENIEKLQSQLEIAVKVLERIADGKNNFPTWEETEDVLKNVWLVAEDALSSIQSLAGGDKTP